MTTTAVGYKQVTLSHGKTRYIEAGTGHPLILLHGSGIDQGADDWLPCLDIMSERHRVIAPDFVGWPPSDTVANADAFPTLTDFVREFQDALGLKSSYVLGASMGAWIAGLLAYESPGRVEKVVITGNPGFKGSPNAGIANWSMPPDDEVQAWVMNVNRTSGNGEAAVQEKLAKIHEPDVAEGFASIMKTMGDSTNRARYALMRRLPYITMPTLLLFGDKDPAMSVADEATKLLPNGAFVALPAGHRLHIEIPEDFSREVVKFLG